MIDYSDPELFLADGIQKQILLTDGTVTVSGKNYSVTGQTVTITNDILEAEAFELYQSLSSSSQLTFGSCESGYISFTMHENIPGLKGKTLKAYIIPDGDASLMLQLGVFKVQEDELTADRTKRQVTAYDAMYDILNADVAAWYNSLLPTKNDTVTLGQMRFAFTAYFGLTQETITLPNDSMVIKRTIEPESLSGADVIKALCELNGCFGTITNEGKFRYVVLSPGLDDGLFPSDTLYPANDLYPQDVNPDVTRVSKAEYQSVEFQDYISKSITGLTIRQSDDDVGTTVGSSGNIYIIQGNFLVFGKNATELTAIGTNALGNMVNRYYKPCTLVAVGNPLHEVGDGIRINTTFRGIVTYILERSLTGIQSLRDTYEAAGEEYFNQELNSAASQFKQLSGKITQIKVDTDGIESRVEDIEDGSASVIQQLDDKISLKVSKSNLVSDLDDEMSGIDVTSNSIAIQSTGVFTVDSTNFKLNSSGVATLSGATFSGTVDSATIQASNIISEGTIGGMYSKIELQNGVLLSTNASQNRILTANWGGMQLEGTSDTSAMIYADHFYLQQGSGISASRVLDVDTANRTVSINGAFTVNGSSVLTSVPTTLQVGQLQNTSGNARINIDYGSSAYNIVLNGSCNIGNGSSNTIRIKGRDVKWVSYGSLTSGDYVLVEA